MSKVKYHLWDRNETFPMCGVVMWPLILKVLYLQTLQLTIYILWCKLRLGDTYVLPWILYTMAKRETSWFKLSHGKDYGGASAG